MKILSLLFKNSSTAAETYRFPQRPPSEQGYRGLVEYDVKLCTGCGVCSYRCTSNAITFSANRKAYTWSYDPGQCTYCGRCVDGCESHAITQATTCPPIYLKRDELNLKHTTERPLPPPKPKPAVDLGAAPATGGAK